MYTAVPYLQIRSNSLIQYSLPDTPYIPTKQQHENRLMTLLNASKNAGTDTGTYSGKITPGAKKRMTRAIELIVMASQDKKACHPKTGRPFTYRLTFLTLTISENKRIIEAKEAHKQCLEPFLQWLRRVHNVNLYIWKAEHQRRGQLHYHITINQYIDYRVLQAKWNELQDKAGWIDGFFANYGHRNPPSTQIKKVLRERNMAGYMCKEFEKTYQNEKSVKGKLWDCSLNLKAESYFTTVADGNYISRLNQLVDQNKLQVIVTDTCTIFKMIQGAGSQILDDKDFKSYTEKLKSLRKRDDEIIKSKKKLEPVAPILQISPRYHQAHMVILKRCYDYHQSGGRVGYWTDIGKAGGILAMPNLFSTS